MDILCGFWASIYDLDATRYESVHHFLNLAVGHVGQTLLHRSPLTIEDTVILLLSNIELSPTDKRRYSTLPKVLGDPIDAIWD